MLLQDIPVSDDDYTSEDDSSEKSEDEPIYPSHRSSSDEAPELSPLSSDDHSLLSDLSSDDDNDHDQQPMVVSTESGTDEGSQLSDASSTPDFSFVIVGDNLDHTIQPR